MFHFGRVGPTCHTRHANMAGIHVEEVVTILGIFCAVHLGPEIECQMGTIDLKRGSNSPNKSQCLVWDGWTTRKHFFRTIGPNFDFDSVGESQFLWANDSDVVTCDHLHSDSVISHVPEIRSSGHECTSAESAMRVVKLAQLGCCKKKQFLI